MLVKTVLGETPLDLAAAHIEAHRRDLLRRLQREAGLAVRLGDVWLDLTTDECAIRNQAPPVTNSFLRSSLPARVSCPNSLLT